MSATNRGARRAAADFYPTPPEPVRAFLAQFGLPANSRILEPCAGSGSIIRCLREYGLNNIDAVELREEERQGLEAVANEVRIGDFLTMDGLSNKYNVIITNPPYRQAREFIEKSLDIVRPGGSVIMLLRTNFLESKSRFDFWQAHPLRGLYVLSKRPSFTGTGTDATSYSWFVWRKNRPWEHEQIIRVI